MTARPIPAPAARRSGAISVAAQRGFLASAAAAVESFFFEPAGSLPAAEAARPVEVRPVVCVLGLAGGCGVTVVARALAAELAARGAHWGTGGPADADGAAYGAADGGGATVVCCGSRPAGVPLATHAAAALATRAAAALARILEDVPRAAPRAVGRLCLVGGADPARVVDIARYHAPVVIDAGSAGLGGLPASVADRTVIVTTCDVEPALARVAAQCVARTGPAPVVALNRAPHDQPGLFALPSSPLGARLALGGREARGELGRAIAELAVLLEEPL